MTDTRNINETINNALDATIPHTMDLVLATNEIIKVQMVDTATDNGWWMDVVTTVNGFGTLIVAVLVYLLMRKQTGISNENKEIEETRRRNELFDRRHPTFKNASSVLISVMFGHKCSDKESSKLLYDAINAPFLFSGGVADFLLDMRRDYMELEDAKYFEITDKVERDKLTKDFGETYSLDVLQEKFSEYLIIEPS